MRHENKKVCRIVDELTTWLLQEDTNEIDLKIKKCEDRTLIRLVDYGTHLTDEDIEEISRTLNCQRQHEVEEYYWQLAGESDCDQELLLLGAMIDEAIVRKEDGNLILELTRMNE